MQECRIFDPPKPILNNNTCRICGLQKPRKEFRKLWSLRGQKIPEMRVWCKTCQKVWKQCRGFPIEDVSFVINLD
jgi:hypothetical protein